jgi:outer membrane protein, heavy metal efflux system
MAHSSVKSITASGIKSRAVVILTGVFLCGCAFQTYSPKPLDPAKIAARYRSHDPDKDDFRDYLLAQDYAARSLPIKQWGPRELVLSALFFNPQLDVARAQWRAAQAAEVTSGERQNPGISGLLENHSETAGGISPWTYGLSIDIPVETGGKRQARIDRAQSLSAAARIEIAQAAWQVRSHLLTSLIEYNTALLHAQLLQQETELRSEVVEMLDARLKVGMVSNTEISSSRLQLQKSRQALAGEQGRIPKLRAALASNAGLPLSVFSRLQLVAPAGAAKDEEYQGRAELQQAALLNRLDIRAALARYDAAEARLRLEIARQYPDVVLSPGYSFDQGDRIWSLGLSTLLSLLNKNEGLIAEARALREVEAAQFEALQAKVISDLEQANAVYEAAIDQLQKSRQMEASQLDRFGQVQRQFDAGLSDRLELVTAKLENLIAWQNVLDTEYKIQRAALALEDAMQHPLDNGFPMPADITQAAGKR